MASYSALSRAQLSYDYLHTNSTTHEFLFGALAELLDNARDASATKINIFTEKSAEVRGGYYLCFLDDGEGMDPNDTADIITFGKSAKRSQDSQKIGMYGNGLKSGSMRIGNDLILFTKKGPTMTCLFLSRSFHEEENIDEVIVPIPSFETATNRSLAKGPKMIEKHNQEMALILRYSPFKTEKEFFNKFDMIEGNCGTLVITYNMKLLDSGESELDVKSIPYDILLTNPLSDFDSDEGMMPERKSFRAYTAILYMEPRMKVYIQGKKVRTKRLASCLHKCRQYKYSSNRFRSRAENEAKKAEDESKGAENKAREAESKAKNIESRYGSSMSREQRAELRKAQTFASECRKEAQIKKQMAERKTRSLKDPKTLNFIFGLNIENRSHDGVFVYNCSRLIRMYEKVGPQVDGGVCCSGIVGIVDIPYLVLEPTHNKQDFADAKEYRHLARVMGEHMEQYWNTCGVAQQITKFWENFGYVSGNWKDPPSVDPKYARKRHMQLNMTLQCDKCLKWRILPFSAGNIGFDFSDDWACDMNNDPAHNRCTAAEQKLNIQEVVFKKDVKTQEQKQMKLEEEIRKKSEMLAKMQKSKAPTPSRQVKKEKDSEDEEEEEEEEEEKPAKKLIVKSPAPISRQNSARNSRHNSSPIYIQDSSETSVSPSPPRSRGGAQRSAYVSPVPLRSERVLKAEREREERLQREEREKEEKTLKATKLEKERAQKAERERLQKEKEREKERLLKEKEREKERILKEKEREKAQKEKDKLKAQKEKEKEALRIEREEEKEEQRIEKERLKEEKEKQKQVVKHPATSSKPNSRAASAAAKEEPTKRRAPAASSTADSDNEVPSKKPKTTPTSTKDESQSDSQSEDTAVESSEMDSGGAEIGTKVEALVKDKWYPGAVVRVNQVESKWKVKFDQNPKDKYDKWYVKSGPEIRLLKPNQLAPESTVPTPTSPASSSETAAEAPSSSTNPTSASTPGAQITDEIGNGYRTCLRYFLPPQWSMDKEAISGLSLDELAAFPLDDFFDQYERGLRKLVNNFQTESTTAKSKLSALRKNIARLLRSLNDEIDIDPDEDGEHVDQLLAACVSQATQQQQQ